MNIELLSGYMQTTRPVFHLFRYAPESICGWERCVKGFGALAMRFGQQQSCTGLHFAARTGNSDLASLLIEYGVNVDDFCYESNKGLTTALVLAAWEGNIETMKILLDRGANPHLCASAESPLYTACEHHKWDKANLLLTYGARHDVFTAAISGDVSMVKALVIAYPSLISARSTKRNRTPLEEAIYHKQEDAAKAIIDQMDKADW